MKTNAIIRIVLFSLVILILLAVLVGGIGAGMHWFNGVPFFSRNFGGSLSGGTVSSSGSVNADEVTHLEIEWVAGSITIQPGETDTISFAETEVSDEKYQMIWKQSGDKLIIEYCAASAKNIFGGVTFNIGSDLTKDLVITVPADWVCSSLNIDAASAQVNIQNMTLHEVEFDGASAICVFDQCQVRELSVDTASGDVRFTGTLDILDFDAMSASFIATFDSTPSSLKVDTMSGDLDLTLPENSGFSVKLDAMSGDFSSDFPTTMSGGSYVCGDGSCHIDVSAMSGDVTIRKGEAANDQHF